MCQFEIGIPYRSRVRSTIIFQLPPAWGPNFCVFLWVKGLNFKFHFSNYQKALPIAEAMYSDVLCIGMCPKMRPVGVTKKIEKRTHFHASNWLFGQITHVDIAPWHLHAGSRPWDSIYFKFHENRSRGLGAVGVEIRHLPLTWTAYTTVCTTVQAVITMSLIGALLIVFPVK